MGYSVQTVNKAPIFEKKIGALTCNRLETEEDTRRSGHNQPFNILSSGGQEALFPHVLNSKHTGKA